ncbi:hypothetical protein BR93DRAFT_400868 [Coniochaeta sp. PMI_546]|nr:hypothetical protein BR93DRAFT_400868 [Coniochaeta sp. PMI_546]
MTRGRSLMCRRVPEKAAKPNPRANSCSNEEVRTIRPRVAVHALDEAVGDRPSPSTMNEKEQRKGRRYTTAVADPRSWRNGALFRTWSRVRSTHWTHWTRGENAGGCCAMHRSGAERGLVPYDRACRGGRSLTGAAQLNLSPSFQHRRGS